MTTAIEPKCSERNCKHFIGIRTVGKHAQFVCKAFSKGIPEDITYGTNLHLKPYPGDNGIQFEKED